MAVTTQITVDRETAEVMLGATRAWKTLATEMPSLFREGEALRLANAEVQITAAIDRLSYLERKSPDPKGTLRHRLAANLAFPNVGVRGW